MSFGGKQHHHRFFTASKVRSRHVQGYVSPQISRQRYQSVGTVNNPYLPNQNYSHQGTMKQSYLRLVNNGMNSRLFTKDQLGYEGLKFEKDVINRYSQNNYQKNSQVLQKFKRQAQQLKRKKKYRHISLNNKLQTQHYSLNEGMGSYRHQNSQALQQRLPNHSISLLPITNKSLQKQSHYIENISSRNQTKMSLLPQLKMSKNLISNKSTLNAFKDPVIQESQSNNQFLDDDETPFISRVCDVGVNAHLTIDDQSETHRRRKSQITQQKEFDFITRKKSQSMKLQMLKSKNKQLKKKYDKLKRQLTNKSRQLSKQHQKQQQQQNEQQFQQKIQNLSQMIQSICNKLKQNSKMLANANTKQNSNDNNQQIVKQQQSIKKDEPLKEKNQAQINLTQKHISHQQDEAKISRLLRSKYVSEIQKIDTFRKTKPKIVYTYNKDSKNFNVDHLRLLKDKLKSKQFNQNTLKDDYLIRRRRIKTQQS